jgi:hypothetical protein
MLKKSTHARIVEIASNYSHSDCQSSARRQLQPSADILARANETTE